MPEVPNRRATLERARARYAERAWRGAFDGLVAADTESPLAPDDLERLTWSAALIGRDDRFLECLERMHDAHRQAGEAAAAARCAFWLGFRLMSLGEPSKASGWLARARRLVDELGAECVEHGYLLLPTAVRHLRAQEFAEAAERAAEAAAIGDRFGDADLVALARDVQARALLRSGEIDRGMALLDEGMLAASGGELTPLVTGILLCSVISSCTRAFAWERAREWTAVLAAWCDEQPDLVTFRGACQVHRSQVLQLAGEWTEAMVQVERAVRDGPDVDRESVGDASYQQGELHRVRGDVEDADAAYANAARVGRDPQPGLALLRAAQGKRRAAWNGLQRVLAGEADEFTRVRLLPAAIEIALAGRDLAAARQACDELEGISRRLRSTSLDAVAAYARGTCHLAAEDPQAALGPLRRAYFAWQQVGAPYEQARAQAALGRAYAALGDDEGAARAREGARATFTRLGAAPDLAALEAAQSGGAGRLTPRELQVLRLVATGMTNRAIAAELGLSEKTVDRHVSNIFTKLGVTSRAAATAHAYEHALL